jgi:crotonobetainyl-CoA:carnitine CoA-transferase CaiB-like acyl-CoA transferase
MLCNGRVRPEEFRPSPAARAIDAMSGPLAGLRVLDLTTVQMGPWCTRILADYGADMIKVEAPEGDSSRYTGVPRHRGMSGSFQHNARGKRSIAMDLKQPAAREALLRLVPTVEAFASNIRPRALERLGLDFESVRQLNPTIVYLSMVGYGSGGRYAGRPAYDDLIQAASGISMLLQRSSGQPRFIPMAAIDRIVGSAAANALLAGLLARARTGVGQRIEVPMFETMAQFVLAEHMQGSTFDPPTGPPGYARTLSQHRRPYQTKDGFIAVLPYNDGQWRRFFAAIGKSHVVESDPRFADITARTANIDALYEMLGEELKHRTTGEWLDLLQQNDIPASVRIRWRACLPTHTSTMSGSSVSRSIRPKAASVPCASQAPGQRPRRPAAESLLVSASTRGRYWPRQATHRMKSMRWSPSAR